MNAIFHQMNHFQFYDIPESFHPDAGMVKRKFYELSKLYHPDFYINESAERQQEILELSTLNNKAYQVLSNPHKTTEYILEQHNLLTEGGKYQLPQSFLMEMMEVNEALMELEFEADSKSADKIREQVSDIEKSLSDEMSILARQFDNAADNGRESVLKQIQDIWYRQRYVNRIRESLAKFDDAGKN